MAVITPANQTSNLNPYNGTLFEFNNVDSRVYLSRSINSLLNIYGQDVVIDGFKVTSFNYAANALHVTFSAGLAIADQTLVETPSQVVTVPYNTTGLSMPNASIAFFIRFQYLQQFAGNQFSIKSIFVDSAGSSLPSDVFDINTDRVCLAVFDFDAAGVNVVHRYSNAYVPFVLRTASSSFNIDSNSMQIYPISIIGDTVSNVVQEVLS